MAENAGGIYYDIEMDVRGLLTAQQRVNQRLDLMERGFDKTTRSIDTTERSMSSLSRVAVALTAALSVQQVAEYADAWATVNNKLSNSLRPSEQLADVTERVFNITQQTRSSLDATASLYARLERATRQYGTSADDLAKLTTIINQGFVVSGATAQEAENAIIQLSQGLASGALRGEEFNSVNEQGNRLIVALADSMGVSIGQMRNMAAQGKLTTDVVVNGLLSQGAVIGAEFANTTTTISQALQVAGNNITKFFGENSIVRTGAAIFSDAVVTVSENIGGLSAALTAVAAIMGSRYVGALTMAAAAKIKTAAASRTLSAEEKLAAQSTANKAAADLRAATVAKERALDEIRLAEMQKLTAVSATNAAAAEQRLSAARIAAAAAVDNYNRSLAANNAAQAATSSGAGLVSKALRLVGGVGGAAVLAASAILYFSQRAKEARDDANALADSVNELSSKFKTMSNTELAATIGKLSEKLPELSDAVAEAKKNYDDAAYAVKNYNKEIGNYGNSTRGRQAAEALSGAQNRLNIATFELEKAQNRLSQTQNAINIGHATLNGTFKQGIDLLRRDGQEAGIAAGMMGKLGDMINFAARAKQNFNSSSLMVSRSEDGDKLLTSIERQNSLLAITDKRERAIAEARQSALDAGVEAHSNQIRQIEEAAAKRYDLQEAESAGSKSTSKIAQSPDDAAQSLSRQRAELDRLNTGYAEGSLELAKYDARMALGANASTKAIEQSDAQTEAIWKQQQAIKAVAEEEQRRQQAGQNFSGLQSQASPVFALDNQFQQQMAQLDEYAMLYPQKIAEVEATRAQIEEQYRQRRQEAQWEELSQMSLGYDMLTSAVDAFGGNASNAITGLITGTMSAQEAMRSLGNTILNSVINSIVQVGVEALKNYILGQTLGAASVAASTGMAATTASAWAPAAALASLATLGANAAPASAGITSTVGLASGLALAGARYNGGPVVAGSLYRVGEKGKPEIYQASTGKQYMIPGDNGRVISNKDMQGGGGLNVQVVINNQVSNAEPQYVGTTQSDGNYVLEFLISDAERNGPYISTLQSTLGLSRKANGAF
ncbi:MAG TPA: tape measure protein [Klebsiella sp.]|jgi:tape measure domain-containing protein